MSCTSGSVTKIIKMRVASIDLGTNTFNLLIADVEDGVLNIVHRDKRGVKLGRGGLNLHTIQPDAWQRGMDALSEYSKEIITHKPETVIATATSAIRNAGNGNDFVRSAKEKLGIDIHVIDGMEEARLIFEGVRHAVPIGTEPVLVMDIGGGSIEFIIGDCKKILWHNSFEAGASRILDMFSPSEPILPVEIKAIEDYVRNILNELFTVAKGYPLTTLIGSSGSFDAVANMASFIINNEVVPLNIKNFEIPVEVYNSLHSLLIKSDLEQRKAIPGMDLIRVELIVIGSILINIVVKELSLTKLVQSSYAIKEGVIFNFLKA